MFAMNEELFEMAIPDDYRERSAIESKNRRGMEDGIDDSPHMSPVTRIQGRISMARRSLLALFEARGTNGHDAGHTR